MSNEFKVGDRVRIVSTPYIGAHLGVGATGVVADARPGFVDVRADAGPPTDGEGAGWSFSPGQLEKVES